MPSSLDEETPLLTNTTIQVDPNIPSLETPEKKLAALTQESWVCFGLKLGVPLFSIALSIATLYWATTTGSTTTLYAVGVSVSPLIVSSLFYADHLHDQQTKLDQEIATLKRPSQNNQQSIMRLKTASASS